MDKFTLELFSIDVRKAANQDVKFNVREKTESDFFSAACLAICYWIDGLRSDAMEWETNEIVAHVCKIPTENSNSMVIQ